MQQINSYLYDNPVLVQYDADPNIVQRNRVVYTRPIELYKGIDNVLKIKVQNADQKAVNIANVSLVFTIVDDYVYSNATVVYSCPVVVSNAATGTGTVTILKLDLVQFSREQYTYAVKANVGFGNVATYVDDNYGAAGQLTISSSAYPVNPVTLDLGTIGDSVNSFIEDFGMI